MVTEIKYGEKVTAELPNCKMLVPAWSGFSMCDDA
jgi:hypothetical protein